MADLPTAQKMPNARTPNESLPALDLAPPAQGWGEFAARPGEIPTSQIARNEGLKSAQVHSVVVAPDGRVWMSGPCGLAGYDGARVTCFDRANGLTLQGLRGLGVDGDGYIWVGSDGGLDRLDAANEIKQVAYGETWHHGPAKRIVAMPDRRIFVATSEGLIVGDDNGAFAPVDHPQLHNDVILDLAVDCSGRLVVASALAGISILAGTIWRSLARTVYEEVGVVTRVATSESGNIMVGGVRGLVCVSAEADLTGTTCPLIATGIVSAIRARDGAVWVASSSRVTLLRSRKREWEAAASTDLMSAVNDICLDSYGNLWCATDSAGVHKISFMHAYLTRPILAGAGQIFSIRPGRDGTFLIGAEHALLRAKPGNTDEFLQVERLAGARVWDVLEAADGTLWVATHRFGLLKRDQTGVLDRFGDDDRVLSAPCRSLAEFDGQLWVGTLGGLVSICDGVINERRGPDANSLGYVYALTTDEHNLWIGTLGNGLWRYTIAGGLVRVECPQLARTSNIYGLARNEHGTLALLQDHQLVHLKTTHGEPTGTQVLASSTRPTIGWSLVFTSAVTVAVGSSDGIVEYDFASGREIRQIRCGGTGVQGWEFTSNRALLLDYRGRLWCGLNSGLTLFEPNDLALRISPPTVKLIGIEWLNTAPTRVADRYVVGTGRWRATIRFFSAWLVDETDVQFRHKLVGFDEQWSPLHTAAEFSVTSLMPGTYLIEVQAFSALCGYGPITQLGAIEVTAPWWSRLGLGTVVAGWTALVGLFSGRARNQHLLETNKALAEAVEHRTIEVTNANLALNEANTRLNTLMRIDPVTEIANRRRFDEVVAAEWKRAVRERSTISLMMVDIDFFKLFNDRYGHPRGDACLRLVAQCLATTLREGIDTCARYGGEEFVIVLPHTKARNALMLAERLCHAVDKLNIENVDSPIAPVVTVSIGVNTMEPTARDSVAQLIAGADQSLYGAKRTGRNRVGITGGD